MMVEIGNLEVMGLLSKATNGIAEGEVQQLTYLRNPDISEAMYFDVIYRKTALLFEVAAHSGVALSGADSHVKIALQTYGKELGMAFQLMDDVLDYEGKTGELGKNVGDDLAEGKVTLPLIIALASGSRDQHALIRSAITDAEAEPDFEAIIEAVRLSGGIDRTIGQAQQHRDLALDQLNMIDGSPFKTALSQQYPGGTTPSGHHQVPKRRIKKQMPKRQKPFVAYLSMVFYEFWSARAKDSISK